MPITTKRKGGVILIAGLDVSKPAEFIGDQSSPDVQNFYVDRSLLSKRLGTIIKGSTIGGLDIEIMSGREFNREGVQYNVRIGMDRVEYYDSGSSAWTNITGTTLTGDATDLIDTAVPLLSGKTILCITNGVDAIRKWTATGNTADLGGTPPRSKFIQEYKTYLVCANITGGTDVSQRVQWSDTANPEEWTTGNAGAVDLTEDGEDITGLALFGTYLCVHKKTCIYIGTLVSSSVIFQFDRRVTQAGTVANDSIVNLPSGQQIFLAEDGIRLFNGVTAPLIESPINDEIRDGLNKEYAVKSWGQLVIERDEVWLGIPIGSQTRGETVYKYNYNTGAIHKDTRTGINYCWKATQSTGLTWDQMAGTWDDQTARWNDGQLGALTGEYHFGSIYGLTTVQRTGLTNDNGVTITASWSSKDYQSEVLGQLLRFQEIWLWAKGSGTVTVEYSTDEGASWTEASGSPITLAGTFPSESSPMRVYIDVVALKMRARFTHDEPDGTLQVKQFFLAYTEREVM